MITYEEMTLQAEHRRADIQREAAQEQLMNHIRGDAPGWMDRLLARAGQWMIAAGMWMKRRRKNRLPAAQRSYPVVWTEWTT